MIILVTGSTGFIGSALVRFLTAGGHSVRKLVRSEPTGEAEFHWQPESESIDMEGLEGVDAVVHLAGENIAAGRWTPAKKARILDSRVKGTRLLCESLAQLAAPPKVLVCSSGIGYYGARVEGVANEQSPLGDGFLADVCYQWEEATAPAAEQGIRVVNLRTGIVLDPAGGTLERMLPPFKMGVGGKLGNGRQYISWLTLDDLLEIIHHALVTEQLQGPVNAVTPEPVTNIEFTKMLGRVLGRPTIFPMPTFAVHLIFGEMADETLLASNRAEPAQLLESGYTFRYPELEGALRYMLGKSS